MTINFPKFPNDRRDKNRPSDPNVAVSVPLESTLNSTANLALGSAEEHHAHNRSHQDMLTQTDQLQPNTRTTERRRLKKRLSHTTLPQKPKSLPLMPILLGLILLAGGGAMGYMYQAYTQPPTPAATPVATNTPATAPVTVNATATPQPTATMPASGVTGTVTAVTSAQPAPSMPPSDKSTVTAANNPNNTNTVNTAPVLKPATSDATPAPISSMNADNNLNSKLNNNPNPNLTAPPPVNKPVGVDNPQNLSTDKPASTTTPSLQSNKNTASYDDFVKSSENTVFIEPPNHK